MNRWKNQTVKSFLYRNRQTGGYLLKKELREIAFKLIRALLLFGLCFLILQPLLNKLSLSFMQERDLYDATVIAIPRNFTTGNYKLVARLIGYWRALLNTIGVALLVSMTQIAFCTLVGYGFARFQFPLKKLWFACVMLVIIVPPQTITSSLYLHFRFFDVLGIFKALTGHTINLQNSMLPYLMMCMGCMGLKSGLYVFLIRQFFRGVPKELEEAAYVDGCGTFSTFLKIMLPDAKPILTSCFLFSFVWQWTDSFYSKLFLGNIRLLPKLLTSISGLLDDYMVSINGVGSKATVAYAQMMISTGMIMAIIPLLIIYIVAQRGFVESLSQSGIKM